MTTIFTVITVAIVVVVVVVVYFYFFATAPTDEEEEQICGVMQLERAVFLKKPPFKSKQIVNINIKDVKNTGGEFKQKITNIVKKDVAPFVNLKFKFANKPSASGAMITVSNDDVSLVEKGANGTTRGMGKPKVSIDIRDGAQDRTVIWPRAWPCP